MAQRHPLSMSTSNVSTTPVSSSPSSDPGVAPGRDATRRDWNWESLRDKQAKTLDGFDLGEVKHVANEYIFTEKGTLKKDKFYIPKRFADRFDGSTLWFSVTKPQAESEFKRDAPLSSDDYAKRYTTSERRITERVIETGPSGEQKETIIERKA